MAEISRDVKKCPNCDYHLLYEFRDDRISLVIPGNDLHDGLMRWINQVYSVYEGLRQDLNSFLKSFESSRKSAVDVEVYPFFRLNRMVKVLNIETTFPDRQMRKIFVFLMVLDEINVNIKHQFGSKSEMNGVKTDYGALEAITNTANKKNRDGTAVLEVFQPGEFNGAYNKQYGIQAVEIGESFVEDVFSKADEVPSICLPLFVSNKIQDDKFKAHLAHELTHAYIDRNTNYDRHDHPVLYALDEACCNVVTEFYYPGFFSVDKDGVFRSLSVSSYRGERNMPKSQLITGIKAFQEIVDESNSSEDEIIDTIRMRGVAAIKRMQNKQMPIHEAITGDRSLESEFESIKSLEMAEYKMFHAFLLLDIIEESTFNDYKDWTEDISAGEDPQRESEMIVEEDLKSIQKALPEIERLAREENGELAQELKQLHTKLRDLLEKEQEEQVYLRHPFCPSCGHVVKPGNYCPKCGQEISPDERKSLEDAINYVLKKTTKGAGFLIKRNRIQHNNRREIIENYGLMVEYAERENRVIMKSIEDIHDEEGKLAEYFQKNDFEKQYSNIEKLIDRTEEIYEVSKKAEKNLQRAEELLKKAYRK